MRKLFLFLILSCPIVCGQTGAVKNSIALENSRLRVLLSPKDGKLLRVEDKQNHVSSLSPFGQAGWFRLQVPLPEWDGHLATGAHVVGATMRRVSPEEVEFSAAQLRTNAGVFPIAVKIGVRLAGDNLVCRMRVRNSGKRAISRVVFPIVDVGASDAGTETLQLPTFVWPLRVLFSDNEVRSERNPFDSLDPLDIKMWFYNDPRIGRKAFDYPMGLPTAWAAYLADGHGVGYDVRDKSFQFQRFIIERRLFRDTQKTEGNRRDYELSWNWYPVVREGQSWQTAEVYIKFGGADWHAYAAQHRDALRTWIQRPPAPETFKSSLGWISRGIRSYDDIPVMAQQGVDAGAPYFIIYGWSSIGPEGMSYGAYPRSETGGLESLQKNLLAARKLGAHPLAWSNETVTVETNLEHQEMGKHWVALDRFGGRLIDGRWSFFEPYQVDTVPNNDNWFQTDPSSSAKEFLLDIVRRITGEYHFSGYEMDQGHKNYLSYRDPSIPAEYAYTRGVEDLLRKAQKIVKTNDPDGIIVGENPNEHLGQFVDSIWIFEGGELNVELMTRQRYSIPWDQVSTKGVATNRGQANLAFVLNCPLDIFDDLSHYPEYAAHLRKLHALKKAVYRYMYQGDFSDEDDFTLVGPKAKEVVAKSYVEPVGKFLAVFIANSGKDALQVVLNPQTPFSDKSLHRYQLNGLTEKLPTSQTVQINLAPYDVQVFVFED